MMDAALLQITAGAITSPLLVWFPVAIAGALAIISIIAIMYMLSTFTGRNDLKVWARTKIYEVLLSVVLIFIFFAVVAFLMSVPFGQIFGSVGLVPTECSGVSDLFTLAVCNMYHFNGAVVNIGSMVYGIGVYSTILPSVRLNFNVLGVGTGITLDFAPTTLASSMSEATIAVFTMYVLNQVQLLLLCASLLLFSMFLGLGLIARMFVITKSFGGAMIAIGVGLGLIYPLLVCLTYGYVNVGLDASNIQYGVTTGAVEGITGLVGTFLTSWLTIPYATATFHSWLTGFLMYASLAAAGLVFLPLLNFVILDVFILDFSQAIGERMNFMSLLTGMV